VKGRDEGRGGCNDNKERLPEGENGRDIYCTCHVAFNYRRLPCTRDKARSPKRDNVNHGG